MLKQVPLSLGIDVDSDSKRTPTSQGEEPETEAETAAEIGFASESDVVAKEFESLRNSIATEVHNRSVAMAHLEQRCTELQSALVADRERTKNRLDVQIAECGACPQLMTTQLSTTAHDRHAQHIESPSAGWSPRGENDRSPPLAVHATSFTTASCTMAGGKPAEAALHIRCGRLEAELGDTKHLLEDEMRAMRCLTEEVDQIREKMTSAVHTELSTALVEENEQRVAACSRLEVEICRVGDELCRLEEEVVRRGFETLELRLDEVAQTVPAEVSRASICAVEKHLDLLANSVREELSRQEERVMDNVIRALEARLVQLTVSLREEVCAQEERLVSNFWGTPDAASNNTEGGGRPSMQSMQVRFTEFASMLREEARRQDALEARIAEIAAAFHDELRRQEEVVIADGLAGLENRLERLAELLREEFRRQETEVFQNGLSNQEAVFLKLIQEVRAEQTIQQDILSDLSDAFREDGPHKESVQSLRDELQSEITGQATQINELGNIIVELRTQTESWNDREKELWHALDTHTHDVALKQKKGAATVAAASAKGAATIAEPAHTGSAGTTLQRWGTPISSRSTVSMVSESGRLSSAEPRGSASTLHTSSTSVLRGDSMSSLSTSVVVVQPPFTQPVLANVRSGASISRSPSGGPSRAQSTGAIRQRESSTGRLAAPAVAGATGAIAPSSSGATNLSPQVMPATSGVHRIVMPRGRTPRLS